MVAQADHAITILKQKSLDPKTAHFALFARFYDNQNLYFLTANIIVPIYSIGLLRFFLK